MFLLSHRYCAENTDLETWLLCALESSLMWSHMRHVRIISNPSMSLLLPIPFPEKTPANLSLVPVSHSQILGGMKNLKSYI